MALEELVENPEVGLNVKRGAVMKGVRYMVDDDGRKSAVVIDLKQWGELWEDIHDAVTAAERKTTHASPWPR